MNTTILYYTTNRIHRHFGKNIQKELVKAARGLPIISISHKPMNFGHNICVGDIGILIYNVYKQILIGAKAAKTKYIACAEDDCLYTYEHFCLRPPDDTFYYNMKRWSVDSRNIYYHRRRTGMWQCVAPRDLMIAALEERFEKFPDPIPPKTHQPAEPGKRDKEFGLIQRKMEIVYTKSPIVTFNHRPSLGGKRKILRSDKIAESIHPWGDAASLWNRIYGRR